MKKVYLLYIGLIFVLASCSGGKKITSAANVADGLSYHNAVVINEEHETPGIHAEYAWVRVSYPGSKVNSQSLNSYKGKSYDILHITTADGQQKAIYFDISKFFGKF